MAATPAIPLGLSQHKNKNKSDFILFFIRFSLSLQCSHTEALLEGGTERVGT
jgi:hypothetical protein